MSPQTAFKVIRSIENVAYLNLLQLFLALDCAYPAKSAIESLQRGGDSNGCSFNALIAIFP